MSGLVKVEVEKFSAGRLARVVAATRRLAAARAGKHLPEGREKLRDRIQTLRICKPSGENQSLFARWLEKRIFFNSFPCRA